jgi:hypothetical protein
MSVTEIVMHLNVIFTVDNVDSFLVLYDGIGISVPFCYTVVEDLLNMFFF